jgi:hypothetical protein
MRRVVMVGLERVLGVEKSLIIPSPEAHTPKGLYLDRTMVRDHREVQVRVLNVTRHDQRLTKGSRLVHCERVTLVTPPDVEQPQVRDTTLKLQGVIAAARTSLTRNPESWKNSSPNS